MNLIGSIDLTKVPKRLFKKVTLKNGETHIFLNVGLWERREPQTFGERTYTHSLKCSVPKEEIVEGENLYIGDFAELKPREPQVPTPEQVQTAPEADPNDLPF